MTKQEALLAIKEQARQSGLRINQSLMSYFYDYFHETRVSEISLDQFIAIMTSDKLQFSVSDASTIFQAFDGDRNGALSLSEIGVGTALLTEGSLDSKLGLIFRYERN